MIDKNIFIKIDECTDEFELEKIKVKILYMMSKDLEKISKKRLTYG